MKKKNLILQIPAYITKDKSMANGARQFTVETNENISSDTIKKLKIFKFVKRNYTPGDGAYTIVVDTERVYTCFLKYPTNYHDWSTTGTRSYSSKEELLKILKELINRSANCWA